MKALLFYFMLRIDNIHMRYFFPLKKINNLRLQFVFTSAIDCIPVNRLLCALLFIRRIAYERSRIVKRCLLYVSSCLNIIF